MSKDDKLDPYQNLKNCLIKTGEYEKFTDMLSKPGTFKEKFSEIWKREDLVKVIPLVKPNNNYNRKDNLFSERFLSNGNRLCGERKLGRALIAYNFAVLSASSSKDTQKSKDIESVTPLVFAYATRSALLYDMERYADSIRDIDRAIEQGYPESKIDKLEERRIKCLLKLKNNKAAEKKVKYLIEKAKDGNETSSIEHLEDLLNQCRIKTKTSKNASTIINVDLFQRGPETPLFLKKYNKDKDISIMYSSVKINYSSSQGKHLIASRDIEPGEILMVEKAICSIPRLNEMLRFNCCVCLRKATVPLPCENCSLVSFCSDKCIASKHSNHEAECSVLPLLLDMKIDEELGLVFRTLLKFTMEDILSELESSKNLEVSVLNGLKDAKTFSQSPTSYLTLTKLEGNLSKRSGDSVLESGANAVLGVKLLQKVSKFWERKNKSDPPIEQNFENLTTLGGEIITLLLNFQCNIHCIKELQIDTKENIVCSENINSGYGVYKNFSLINHSCAPNVLHSSWGDVKFLYSINFIAKGEEVLDSYGERFVSHELNVRKNNLKDVYYFDCQCVACKNNWPLFLNLPIEYSLICPTCHKSIDKSVLKCASCDISSSETENKSEKKTNIKQSNDIKQIVNKLKLASVIYDNCLAELNQYKTSFENIKHIGNYISLLNRHTNVPHKVMVEAQEVLLRSFDIMGSFSYKGYSLFD